MVNMELWVPLLISRMLNFYFKQSFKTEFHSVYDNLTA